MCLGSRREKSSGLFSTLIRAAGSMAAKGPYVSLYRAQEFIGGPSLLVPY
jgi:hypothetical protein